MEDIIFFAVVAISIIISVVKNYKQEAKKNSKRVIVKPATPQNRAGNPRPISSPPKQVEPINTIETLETLENTKSAVSSYSRLKVNKVSEINSMSEMEEHDYSQDDEIKSINENDDPLTNNVLLNDKDELKRAVIYSTILERRY